MGAVALAGLLPGCIVAEDPCPEVPATTMPWVGGDHLATDPRQPWESVILVEDAVKDVTLSVSSATAGEVTLEEVADSGNGIFAVVRAQPIPQVNHVSVWVHSDLRPECAGGESIQWDLAAPVEGETARPGQGVHVMTAGFWRSNGTLFYTNIKEVDQDAMWPRAEWYGWEGGEPLAVYVYDQARTEEPAFWHGTTAGTPAGAPTQNATLWDYGTTIPGFNAALKGLSTNTARVALLTPEEGYTREGNEAHPLYGAALVFYIKVLDVVDLPCPGSLDAPLCDVPSALAHRALPRATLLY